MANAAARRLYVPESANVARTFLADLRQVHRNLLVHLQELEALTAQAEPDRTPVTTARWKLGQASLARRLLANRICDYFEARCDAGQVATLKSLRTADRDMLRISASHLGKWTAESIFRNWPDYCSDGLAMRRRASEHIALEQRVLYPMLEEAARA